MINEFDKKFKSKKGFDANHGSIINVSDPIDKLDAVNLEHFDYFNTIQEYSQDRSYPKGFIVNYNGRLYIANEDTNDPAGLFDERIWSSVNTSPIWKKIDSQLIQEYQMLNGDFIAYTTEREAITLKLPLSPFEGETLYLFDIGRNVGNKPLTVTSEYMNIRVDEKLLQRNFTITTPTTLTVLVYTKGFWEVHHSYNEKFLTRSTQRNSVQTQAGERWQLLGGRNVEVTLPKYVNNGESIHLIPTEGFSIVVNVNNGKVDGRNVAYEGSIGDEVRFTLVQETKITYLANTDTWYVQDFKSNRDIVVITDDTDEYKIKIDEDIHVEFKEETSTKLVLKMPSTNEHVIIPDGYKVKVDFLNVLGNKTVVFASEYEVITDEVDEDGIIKYIDFNGIRRKTPIIHGTTILPEDVMEVTFWGFLSDQKQGIDYRIKCNKAIQTVPNKSPKYITSMKEMFKDCNQFNSDISKWGVKHVKDMESTFENADSFNSDISNWDVMNVTNMSKMFKNAYSFNSDISKWNVSNVKDMSYMFNGAFMFNSVLKDWDTSSVTNMSHMFDNTNSFNRDISMWDIRRVTDLSYMFHKAIVFDQDLSRWNLRSVETVEGMFMDAVNFNTDINMWTTTSIVNMKNLFNGASRFNQPIVHWDTSNVTNMESMFECATSFNRDISEWDTFNVTNMDKMFKEARTFNQDLSKWCVSKILTEPKEFDKGAISWDKPRPVWGTCPPKAIEGYIQWKKGSFEGQTEIVHGITILEEGITEVTEWGYLKEENIVNGIDYGIKCPSTLLEVPEYEPPYITTMFEMFKGCKDFSQNLDQWDISNVTSLESTFENAVSFNGNISTWDTSNVTNMSKTFKGARSFNKNINSWKVQNVTTMEQMFAEANDFNSPLDSWQPIKVTTMKSMFSRASSFNQQVHSWRTNSLIDCSFMFYRTPNFSASNNFSFTWFTGNVKTMESMFEGSSSFDGNISSFNVENVTTMKNMFKDASMFNKNLNSWNTKSLKDISGMFDGAMIFNSRLDNWKTHNITNMAYTFRNARTFNKDLSAWDTDLVVDMTEMFNGAFVFNQDLSEWCVSKIKTKPTKFDYNAEKWSKPRPAWGTCPVKNREGFITCIRNNEIVYIPIPQEGEIDLSFVTEVLAWGKAPYNEKLNVHFGKSKDRAIIKSVPDVEPKWCGSYKEMFKEASLFNSDISKWNTSKVVDMSGMFHNAVLYNQNLNDWDVSNVTSMKSMFKGASSFNKNINKWNISKVTDISSMFYGAKAFNQNIGSWDISNVTNMTSIFQNASSFNSDISTWNTTKITSMESVFNGATAFNQNISNWDTRNVTNMSFMFKDAKAFNQDISKWNISKVTNMSHLFDGATAFNKNISKWNVSNIINMSFMFKDAKAFNQDISKWNTKNATDMTSMFNGASNFNQDLTYWCVPKITTKPSNFDNGASNWKLPRPMWGTCFTKDEIIWENAEGIRKSTKITKDVIIPSEASKIILWGSPDINGVNISFEPNSKLKEVPNVCPKYAQRVSFKGASIFNDPNVTKWDISNLIDVTEMFMNASSFNQNINNWNISHLNDFSRMFKDASSFNQPLDKWSVTKANNMTEMFSKAKSFNQDIGMWDVSNVTNMTGMFDYAEAFNQNLSLWCVTKIKSKPANFDRGAKSWNKSRPIWGVCPTSDYIIWEDSENNAYVIPITKTVTIPINAVKIVSWGKSNIKDVSIKLDGSIDNPPKLTKVPDHCPEYASYISFEYARINDPNLINWNTSNLTNMKNMFKNTTFNQPIGKWDVSNVTNMEGMFSFTRFTQNISNWNTSKVTNMSKTFFSISTENIETINISNWDTSSVTNMSEMFSYSNIDADLSKWNVSKVKNMSHMFSNSTMNPDISKWDVSNVTNMSNMFDSNHRFNRNIGNWNVSEVTNMASMFSDAISFNQDISKWDVSSVKDMNFMFKNANVFNQDLSKWCVLQITSQPAGFDNGALSWTKPRPVWGTCPRGEIYNKEGYITWRTSDGFIGKTKIETVYGVTRMSSMTHIKEILGWGYLSENTTNKAKIISIILPRSIEKVPDYAPPYVNSFSYMFEDCYNFNDPNITKWDTSNITDMSYMFWMSSNLNSKFNQPIGSWNTSNVTNMNSMFVNLKSFNQNINNWDVSNVTSMSSMFFNAFNFNQPLDKWDVSNVISMGFMFQGARKFNQDISRWNVSSVLNMSYMFNYALTFNQDLSKWCVSQIKSKPDGFDETTDSWTKPKPVWGTCPRGEDKK